MCSWTSSWNTSLPLAHVRLCPIPLDQSHILLKRWWNYYCLDWRILGRLATILRWPPLTSLLLCSPQLCSRCCFLNSLPLLPRFCFCGSHCLSLVPSVPQWCARGVCLVLTVLLICSSFLCAPCHLLGCSWLTVELYLIVTCPSCFNSPWGSLLLYSFWLNLGLSCFLLYCSRSSTPRGCWVISDFHRLEVDCLLHNGLALTDVYVMNDSLSSGVVWEASTQRSFP